MGFGIHLIASGASFPDDWLGQFIKICFYFGKSIIFVFLNLHAILCQAEDYFRLPPSIIKSTRNLNSYMHLYRNNMKID